MNSVYRRTLATSLCVLALAIGAAPRPAHAQSDPILEARDALRRKDGKRLVTARDAAVAQRHPLAPWADYWELSSRLGQAQPSELTAFFERWPDTYVTDRLRNDWLLELGRRRDWTTFAAELPHFRMNDDREVACYALLIRQQAGEKVGDAARDAWIAQRDGDTGCATMAATLHEARQLSNADVWLKARLSTDANRPRAVRQALALIGADAVSRFDELLDSPARYLARKGGAATRQDAELTTMALIRVAAGDPDAAAAQLDSTWGKQLPPDLAAWAWASAGRYAAQRLSAQAPEYFQRAARGARDHEWMDETLAWKARAALRAGRWQQVVQAIGAMSAADQKDPAWIYWKARGLQVLARDSQDGEGLRRQANDLLESIAGQHHYYGKLAAEDLGRTLSLPPRASLTEEEKAAARNHPGLARALQLIEMGLRSEGVREWNWTLSFTSAGRMSDRQLLAAAQFACDRQVWDRCINTSDRTQAEFDFEQRFPTPFRREVVSRAKEIGLDPAYVYGLIRQESRFIMDARSHVGASGLMQLMPATARWTARKIGLAYTPDMITDRDVNIALGTSYLKLVLDDLGGSQAMAAAAYNAGPGRPRRWRDGAQVESPIWVENIPFSETRDYVKKVLSNATYYGALIHGKMPSLKARLGQHIGPRSGGEPEVRADLP